MRQEERDWLKRLKHDALNVSNDARSLEEQTARNSKLYRLLIAACVLMSVGSLASIAYLLLYEL